MKYLWQYFCKTKTLCYMEPDMETTACLIHIPFPMLDAVIGYHAINRAILLSIHWCCYTGDARTSTLGRDVTIDNIG